MSKSNPAIAVDPSPKWTEIAAILKKIAEGNAELTGDESRTLVSSYQALKAKTEKVQSEIKAKDLAMKRLGIESDFNGLMNGAIQHSSMRPWDPNTISINCRMELPNDFLTTIHAKISGLNTQNGEKLTQQSRITIQQNSAHFLWREILTLLLNLRPSEETDEQHSTEKDKNKDNDNDIAIRVVYEWPVLHPIPSHYSNRMDYTFLPATRSHMNWLDFSGGMEVKIPAINQEDTWVTVTDDATETFVTHSCIQAAQCAAMGTYARWKEASEQGCHRCFCFYADSWKIGAVRVMIDLFDGSYSVRTEILGPFDLPGYQNPNNPTPTEGIMMLELLAKVLHSPPNSLEELSSEPPHHTPPTVSGFLNGDPTEETSWTLGPLIGAGAFGLVYETSDSDGEIIKIMMPFMNASEKRRLAAEKEALDALAGEDHDSIARYRIPR